MAHISIHFSNSIMFVILNNSPCLCANNDIIDYENIAASYIPPHVGHAGRANPTSLFPPQSVVGPDCRTGRYCTRNVCQDRKRRRGGVNGRLFPCSDCPGASIGYPASVQGRCYGAQDPGCRTDCLETSVKEIKAAVFDSSKLSRDLCA